MRSKGLKPSILAAAATAAAVAVSTALLLFAAPAAVQAAAAATGENGQGKGNGEGGIATLLNVTFNDLRGHWAQGHVDSMVQAGILKVEGDGGFRPEEPITRLDFAVWVAKSMEMTPETPETPGQPPFIDWTDIPEADRPWVAAAVTNGLISGYPEPDGGRSFRPRNNITRAELGTVFGRALAQLGMRLQPRFLYVFEDREEIPVWATEVAASVQAEVIMGRPGLYLVKFAPQSLTKRSEAAAMINRFLNARMRLLPADQRKPLPAPRKATLVTAYYYRGAQDSYNSVERFGRDLDLVYYFGFSLDSTGNFSGGFSVQRDLDLLRGLKLPVLAVVTFFDGAGISALLGNNTAREKALDNIMKLMDQGYSGVNLDFEGMNTADRDNYTAFVRDLTTRLKMRGLLSTVAVPARTSRTAATWGRAYDYEGIGRHVDYLVVMTYDQHWRGSQPGPVGAADWSDEVMSYAAGVVPPEKLLLGIPSYGYSWPLGENGTHNGQARAVYVSAVLDLARERGVVPPADGVTGESSFEYVDDSGVRRLVYYTDPQGLRLKLALLHKHKLGGVAMWRLGYEPAQYWEAFRATAGGSRQS